MEERKKMGFWEGQWRKNPFYSIPETISTQTEEPDQNDSFWGKMKPVPKRILYATAVITCFQGIWAFAQDFQKAKEILEKKG